MLLPALGNIGINYIAPLVVAKLVGRIAGDTGTTVSSTLPYVLGFEVYSCSRRRCGASACTA